MLHSSTKPPLRWNPRAITQITLQCMVLSMISLQNCNPVLTFCPKCLFSLVMSPNCEGPKTRQSKWWWVWYYVFETIEGSRLVWGRTTHISKSGYGGDWGCNLGKRRMTAKMNARYVFPPSIRQLYGFPLPSTLHQSFPSHHKTFPFDSDNEG